MVKKAARCDAPDTVLAHVLVISLHWNHDIALLRGVNVGAAARSS